MDSKNLGKILAVIVIVIAVFIGFAAYLPTVDVSTLPASVAPVFTYLISFFGTGAVLTIVALLRNVVGYAYEYVKSGYKETFTDTKLYETIVYYVGFVNTIGSIVPAPYSQIGMAILVVADLVLQATKKLWGK
jgi:hypothetical protein